MDEHEFVPLNVVLGFFLIVVFIGLGWVLPITLGVRCAKRKNYPALWMLFGIHPVGGWIAFIVFAYITPRIRCPNCGGFVKVFFRMCPFCHGALDQGSTENPPGIQ